jgi:nitrate/nitrite transport system permease protein
MSPAPLAVDTIQLPDLTAPPVVPPGTAAAVAPGPTARTRLRRRALGALAGLGWASLGITVFVALWHLATRSVDGIPSPADTATELRDLLGRAFRTDATKGKGVGLQMQASLGRVLKGFGLAAAFGIPLGLFMGSSRRAWRAVNPLVQILRPVSPLAWFPIWLVAFSDAKKAAVFVIFITALWPIVVNTAAGAASVPQDHRNVSRVFKFGRIAYLRHVLIPDSLPSIVTGLRLSMGVAWMVIVAVEMLSGGTGIGFYVWDAYNASNLAGVTSAIVLIGGVGLALDLIFLRLGRAVQREQN